jgi:predicted Zn-dependent peptidase
LHRNDGDFATLEDMLSEVESTTAASLYGYYQKLLSSSSLNIYYVGSEPIEKVSEIIKRRFGKFCGKCSCTPTLSVEPYLEPIEKTEKMSVSQGKLCLGFRTGVCASDKEYFATALLNEIFGGSPASKLFMNVREKMSLCYYCASRYDSFMGNLTVSAGINVSDRELAYGAILNQLEDIKNGKICNEEMTAAKKAVAHSFRQIYDYPFELVAFYRNKELFGIKATPEGYAERFAQVTLDDIVEAAKKVRLDSVFFLEGTLDGYDEEENDD